MKDYKIVAVLWEDHIFSTGPLPNKPDKLVDQPTLTIGFLFKETPKVIVVVSEVEPYDIEQAHYMTILKSTIVGIQEYGTIKLRKFKTQGA